MSLVLNTNIDSVIAQNNLNGSQALLTQSLTRLSSGLRINSAADDAAGLAISQQFTTQINGTNQAINNANDAVSEAQTTAGALTTINNNLQSIRTLAVEAANGSNSASDRQALNNEVQQQIAEITQIAQQTTFNGLNVLNGSSGTTVYQVGANVGDTIAVSLQQGVAGNQIGQYSTETGAAVANTALTSTNTVTINDGTTKVTVGPTASFVGSTAYQGATSAYAKAAAINGAGLQGLTASASTTAADNAAFSAIGGAAGTTASSYSLTINGTQIYSGGGNIAAGDTLTSADVVAQINLSTGTTGVTASINETAPSGSVTTPIGAIVLTDSRRQRHHRSADRCARHGRHGHRPRQHRRHHGNAGDHQGHRDADGLCPGDHHRRGYGAAARPLSGSRAAMRLRTRRLRRARRRLSPTRTCSRWLTPTARSRRWMRLSPRSALSKASSARSRTASPRR